MAELTLYRLTQEARKRYEAGGTAPRRAKDRGQGARRPRPGPGASQPADAVGDAATAGNTAARAEGRLGGASPNRTGTPHFWVTGRTMAPPPRRGLPLTQRRRA